MREGPAISRRGLVAGSLAASFAAGRAEAAAGGGAPVAALRSKLSGRLYAPSDAQYDGARRGQGPTPVDDRFPALVVVPQGADDIARTLEFAQANALEISVRCGGHDILGASTTARGLLIDLAFMGRVAVDPATGIARAGGGARAGILNQAGAAHGRAPVLGMHPHVGVGGLTLGGGIGWLCGTHGAAVDHLLAVDVVTADGRQVRASADENADLFWALRGGGGNFGVATAFTYQLQPVRQVVAGSLTCRVDPARFLRFYRDFLAQSPDALDTLVSVSAGAAPVATVRVCWSGPPDAGEAALRPLRTFAPLLSDDIRAQTYLNFANAGGVSGPPNMFWRGGAFDQLSDAAIETIAGVLEGEAPDGCAIGVLHYMHGALCRTSPAETPLIREPGHILYNVTTAWRDPGEGEAKTRWVLAAGAALAAVGSRQTYVNYLSENGESAVRDAFGPHYANLQAIKRKYDPKNIFRSNRNIRL